MCFFSLSHALFFSIFGVGKCFLRGGIFDCGPYFWVLLNYQTSLTFKIIYLFCQLKIFRFFCFLSHSNAEESFRAATSRPCFYDRLCWFVFHTPCVQKSVYSYCMHLRFNCRCQLIWLVLLIYLSNIQGSVQKKKEFFFSFAITLNYICADLIWVWYYGNYVYECSRAVLLHFVLVMHTHTCSEHVEVCVCVCVLYGE